MFQRHGDFAGEGAGEILFRPAVPGGYGRQAADKAGGAPYYVGAQAVAMDEVYFVAGTVFEQTRQGREVEGRSHGEEVGGDGCWGGGCGADFFG